MKGSHGDGDALFAMNHDSIAHDRNTRILSDRIAVIQQAILAAQNNSDSEKTLSRLAAQKQLVSH